MTVDEENHLFTLSLYKNDELRHDEIHAYYTSGEQEKYEIITASISFFLSKGYALNAPRSGGDVSVLQISGQRYFEKLQKKKAEEDVAKIHYEDEKILIRNVNQSVLDTNISTRKTNFSIRKLNGHQLVAIWIGAIIALLTLIVIFGQLRLSEKQYERDNRDALLLQIQQELKQIQLEKQTLEKSLDSMRGSQISDTAKGKK